MKNVEIDWLGCCSNCGCELAIVTTEHGCNEYLFDDDVVTCYECGNHGTVYVDYSDDLPVAICRWGDGGEECQKS